MNKLKLLIAFIAFVGMWIAIFGYVVTEDKLNAIIALQCAIISKLYIDSHEVR